MTVRRKSRAKPRKKTGKKPDAQSAAPRQWPPIGNQLWKLRSRHGNKPVFESADAMWDACEEYFQWVIDNPLLEERVFCHQGEITKAEVSKMRAMTLEGMYTFLGIGSSTWHDYRSREEFRDTVERVELVMRDYKITGAAADLLNPMIVARYIGLRESMEHTGRDGGPLEVTRVQRTIVDPCKP